MKQILVGIFLMLIVIAMIMMRNIFLDGASIIFPFVITVVATLVVSFGIRNKPL